PSSGSAASRGARTSFVRAAAVEWLLWKTSPLWKKKIFREMTGDDRGRAPVRKTFASLTAPRAAKRIGANPVNDARGSRNRKSAPADRRRGASRARIDPARSVHDLPRRSDPPAGGLLHRQAPAHLPRDAGALRPVRRDRPADPQGRDQHRTGGDGGR